jgi:glycosyl transferase family 25
MRAPKLFIINLERSRDRKGHMLEQIRPYAQFLDFRFFKAVDAQKGEHLEFAGHFSRVLAYLYKGRELSETEKACFASHFSLWRQCADLNEPLFVLEDDVALKDNFLRGVTEIASSNYAYVRLYALFDRKIHHLRSGYGLSFERVSGGQGYYLTPEAAKKFIKKAGSWFCPVDDYLDLFFWHKVPNVLYLPYLLDLADRDSVIGEGRSGTIPFHFKVLREIFRIFRLTYKELYLLLYKRKMLRL